MDTASGRTTAGSQETCHVDNGDDDDGDDDDDEGDALRPLEKLCAFVCAETLATFKNVK